MPRWRQGCRCRTSRLLSARGLRPQIRPAVKPTAAVSPVRTHRLPASEREAGEPSGRAGHETEEAALSGLTPYSSGRTPPRSALRGSTSRPASPSLPGWGPQPELRRTAARTAARPSPGGAPHPPAASPRSPAPASRSRCGGSSWLRPAYGGERLRPHRRGLPPSGPRGEAGPGRAAELGPGRLRAPKAPCASPAWKERPEDRWCHRWKHGSPSALGTRCSLLVRGPRGLYLPSSEQRTQLQRNASSQTKSTQRHDRLKNA